VGNEGAARCENTERCFVDGCGKYHVVSADCNESLQRRIEDVNSLRIVAAKARNFRRRCEWGAFGLRLMTTREQSFADGCHRANCFGVICVRMLPKKFGIKGHRI
jgi:hypothetical protein